MHRCPCAIFPHVAGDQPLVGFDINLILAVAERECHRVKAVMDPPFFQKLPGDVGKNSGQPSDESLSGMP